MTQKTSVWLMAVGCFVAFTGLCFIPAAFGPNPDRSFLAPGAVIFSMGILLVSGSIYVKARVRTSGMAESPSAPAKKARKASCDRCGQDEPVIQCRVHQLHLCGDCLAGHYDFRACAYVPSTRRSPQKSGSAVFSKAASS